jgi:hypothetical protein
MTDEGYRGWLLQVITRPPKSDKFSKLAQTMSFGGGGSGISKLAWDVLHELFGFEYMGSAEYEFGAPAKALEEIINLRKAKKLVIGSITVDAKDIELNKWSRGNSNYDPTVKKRGDKSTLPKPGDTPVYFICRKGDEDQVAKVIVLVARGKQQCKENPQGTQIFDPVADYDRKKIGWLSVTSGEPFIAVTDKEIFDNIVKVFGARKS